MLTNVLLFVIKIYQKAISPLLPARCRFYPTCSSYGIHALTWHGVYGISLLVKRILRCQPWGGSGVDFVPLPLHRYHFIPFNQIISGVNKDTVSYRAFRNYLMNQ